jgi:hypothetical protein
MSATESVTLGIAILGAVTGIIGTGLSIWSVYRELDKDRVKLRVSPNLGIPVGGGGNHPYIMTTVRQSKKTETGSARDLSSLSASLQNPLAHALLILAHPFLIFAHPLLKCDWIQRQRGPLRQSLCGQPGLRGGHRFCRRRCRWDGVDPAALARVP